MSPRKLIFPIALTVAAFTLLQFSSPHLSQPGTSAAQSTDPDVPMSPATRIPHPAPKPGEMLEMSIKALGNFEYATKDGQIPPDVRGLSGSRIRLHGYMIPLDQTTDITRFALVPSLFNCCFGQPPGIQHTVIVTLEPGLAVHYTSDLITTEGTLTVGETKDNGFTVSLFQLTARHIE
jgi:hypothetical protein